MILRAIYVFRYVVEYLMSDDSTFKYDVVQSNVAALTEQPTARF